MNNAVYSEEPSRDPPARGDDACAEDVPQFGAVDIVEAFTAMRHEWRGQTKETRALAEQLQAAVASIQSLEAKQIAVWEDRRSQSPPEARQLVLLIAETDHQLSRAVAAIALWEENRRQREEAAQEAVEREIAAMSGIARWFSRPLLALLAGQRSPRGPADEAPAVAGLNMVLARLRRAMHEQGIDRLDVQGQPFDADTMHAIGAVASTACPPGYVAEQLSPAYRWQGSTLALRRCANRRSQTAGLAKEDSHMTDITHPQGPIVGIDLGTTNSVVAIVVDGQPRVLDEADETLLPSIVGLNVQGQLVTGIAAKNQLAAFPDRTVASIKRRMGSMEPAPLGDQTFTPPEISAMILRKLRDRASRALGQPVSRAVITVPAFSDENQRQATREAAALAGLTAERIINEPTAATLVYRAGSQDRKQIAVYDFGGGTFDVSIVRLEAGVIEVLNSHGDVHLGGDDLDLALLTQLADAFQTEHGVDLRANAHSRYRLLQACEQAKRRLSTDETVEIAEEFIAEKDGRPLHLTATVTRRRFEELIEPFVDRTIRSVDEALRGAGLTLHQIDDLVLVGGSTRIPLVEERLRDEFQREPSRAVDPDLAVALGAAVQAAMIDGRSVGPVLVDVTGHTLGNEAPVSSCHCIGQPGSGWTRF